MTSHELINPDSIQNRIYTIRNLQVMIDSDLAELYGVEIKRLNEQVKRNIERFPDAFCFQLTSGEMDILRSQIAPTKDNGNLKSQFATSSWGGKRTNSYVFTEQGVAMLSAVLRSATAIQISVKIMTAFVVMRRFISTNAQIFHRLDVVEKKQIEYKADADRNFDKIFNAIESKDILPKQGVFLQWPDF